MTGGLSSGARSVPRPGHWGSPSKGSRPGPGARNGEARSSLVQLRTCPPPLELVGSLGQRLPLPFGEPEEPELLILLHEPRRDRLEGEIDHTRLISSGDGTNPRTGRIPAVVADGLVRAEAEHHVETRIQMISPRGQVHERL